MKYAFAKYISLAALAGSLTACGGGGYYYGSIPPPPPPRAVGVVGYAPGPGYVWIEGYHRWYGRGYNWVPGRWERPPHPRALWVPGRVERHGRDYRWREGYWRR